MTAKTFLATALTIYSLLLSAQADITTGLVGYWKLNDGSGSSTAADASGNNNNGTLTGFSDSTYTSMWTNTQSQPVNQVGLIFNQNGDTGDYVSVPDTTAIDFGLNTKAFTEAAWVYLSPGVALTAQGAIMCKGTGGSEAYAMDIASSKFRVFTRNASGGTSTTVSATTAISTGTWYHVVGTYTVNQGGLGHTMEVIYINGVSNNLSTQTFTGQYNSSHPFTIGDRQSSTGAYNLPFYGIIDQVHLYNRVLTPSDVFQLFTNAPINSGIGYWNGLAGNNTLDTTSLNFDTNLVALPVGTAASLSTVQVLEHSDSLPNVCVFPDAYYFSGVQAAVTANNINIASGGVAIGTSNGPGTIYFMNSTLAYSLNSQDNIGIKDYNPANPTSLAQYGAATTILTGTNTFSGGTTISAGTLQLGNGGVTGTPLGSGPVVDNAALVFDGSDSPYVTNSISGTGTLTQSGSGTVTLIGTNTYTGATVINNGTINYDCLAAQTLSGVVSGGGALQESGAGALTLTAAETYSGPTTITGGTLIIGGAGHLASFYSGAMAISSGASFNYNSSALQSLSSTIIGAGALIQSGSGTNVLYGANTYTGTTTISAGTLNLGVGETVGTSGPLGNQAANAVGTIVLSGGTLQYSGANQNDYSGRFSTAANQDYNIDVNGQGVTFATALTSASGELTLKDSAGGGTLTLTAVSTYADGTIINGGTLDVSSTSSIAGSVLMNGGTLELDANTAMSSTATLTLPATPVANMVNLNFTGTQNIGALYFGSVLQPLGTYGASGSGATYTSSGAFTGTGILNVNGSANSYWDPSPSLGAIPGSGGSGSWDNATSDWFTGSSDTHWAANSAAFFEGSSGGTVTVNAPVTSDGLTFTTAGYTLAGSSTLTLDGVAPTVTIPAGSTVIGCPIAGGGATAGLIASGPGTLNLSGTNTYVGATLMTNGVTLSVNSVADSGFSAISTGPVLISGGTELSYTGGGSSTTARAITAYGTTTATIDVPTGTLVLNGQIKTGTDTAAPVMTKTSPGTLIMGGILDNSSLTMAINQGEVIITKSSASTVHGLGGGTSTVGAGTPGNSAELQLSGSGGFDLYSGCLLTVNGIDGFLDVNGQSDTFNTLTLSGSGPTGIGVLINSASGTTSTLNNAGSAVVLAGNATIGGAGNITLASIISGSGYSLTYAGGGLLTLGAVNTFNGGLFINGNSKVQINNAAGAGSGTITIGSGGTLNANIANGILMNTITGDSTTTINIIETPADNLTLACPMSGFSGTINCPATPGTTAKTQITNGTVNLPSTATINVAAGGTFFLQNSSVVNAATVNLYGAGNTEVYGAFRIDIGAVQSGQVNLYGNTTMGDGNTGTPNYSTISGDISDTNSLGVSQDYGFTETIGNLVLSGTNTYGGATIISNGSISLGATGSISNSRSIQLAPGTTFNVSAVNGGFFVANNQTISNIGVTASATINGSVTMNSGSLSLVCTNGVTPLILTNGTMTLANNPVTVAVLGSNGLPAGDFPLILGTNGTNPGLVTGSVSTSPLTITGLGTNATASLLVSNNDLYLAVVATGPPVLLTSPPSLTVLAGDSATLTGVFNGTLPFTTGWQFNGNAVSNNTRIGGAGTVSLTITNVQFSDAGTYQLFVTNGFGRSQTAPATLTVLPVEEFTGGAGWSAQGTSFAWLSTNALRLTDSAGDENNSAFFSSPVYVGAFQASFTYQVINPTGTLADGITFCIQNDPRGAAALGGDGGQLGYGPLGANAAISPSVAFEINLFTTAKTGVSFGANGSIGPNGGTAPLVFTTGDVISNYVTYDGTTVAVTMTDATASTSFSTNALANIPADLDTNVAYVGFTGADGGSRSTQVVSNFTFVPIVGLGIQQSGANVVISWPEGAGGYVLQQNSTLGTANWVNVTNTVNVVNYQNQVVVPIKSVAQFYQLSLQ